MPSIRQHLALLVLLLGGAFPILACAQPDDGINRSIEETVTVLRDLIRIDTTNPPGNEGAAASYIQKIFDREEIRSRLIECAPGRANIVARLKGIGRGRPILLMAHMDVVGVERGNWSFDPFAAELRDGYVLGRGAADDKAMLAANLELMLLLKRSGMRFDRDIIFVGTAGEEGTPEFGINCLLEKSPAEVDAEFALNEGGDAPLQSSSGVPLYVAISTAEKTPRPIRIIAKVHQATAHFHRETTQSRILRSQSHESRSGKFRYASIAPRASFSLKYPH